MKSKYVIFNISEWKEFKIILKKNSKWILFQVIKERWKNEIQTSAFESTVL